MSSIQQIADRWNYIQGGFTYIDANKQCEISNTVELSMAELRFFISSLANVSDIVKQEIVNGLNLTDNEQAFDKLPKSFLVMLDCDSDYLQSEPQTPMNSEFGSVAIALLYRRSPRLAAPHLPYPNTCCTPLQPKPDANPSPIKRIWQLCYTPNRQNIHFLLVIFCFCPSF